jgi:Cu/Zn superoxide dismutase
MTLVSGRRLVAALAVSVGVVGSAGVAYAATAGSAARSAGPEYVYGAGNPFEDASAVVQVVGRGDGSSLVTLHVSGADAVAWRTFGAHVHQSPCGPTGTDAGPHYQHAGATGSVEEREVWLDFTVNPDGNGHAETVRPWTVDETAPRSVIIHADPTTVSGAAGARLACIDLDGEA